MFLAAGQQPVELGAQSEDEVSLLAALLLKKQLGGGTFQKGGAGGAAALGCLSGGGAGEAAQARLNLHRWGGIAGGWESQEVGTKATQAAAGGGRTQEGKARQGRLFATATSSEANQA